MKRSRWIEDAGGKTTITCAVLIVFAWGIFAAATASAQEAQTPPVAAPAVKAAEGPSEHPASVRYLEKELFVQVPNSFPHGLDVVEVRVDSPGRHPLALLTHGTSDKEEERQHVTPWAQLGQALWFARRGYVVIVVTRKGYGRSGGERDGKSGGCGAHGSFVDAGEASANDLKAVARWAGQLPEVDPETIISAGVSTGGFAQVALSGDPPKGLKAAISFAGGRGGDGKENNCDLAGLVGAFHEFGKRAARHGAIPMLWIYSQNDHWFTPAMGTRFQEAYQKGGGVEEFVMAPPDGDDGHHLYRHIDAWSPTVQAFLKVHDLLPLGDEVLPAPVPPNVPPPPGLHDQGLEAWRRFLLAAPFKAFAMTGTGQWGSAGGTFDQGIADQEAMDRCRNAAAGAACQVVARTIGAK